MKPLVPARPVGPTPSGTGENGFSSDRVIFAWPGTSVQALPWQLVTNIVSVAVSGTAQPGPAVTCPIGVPGGACVFFGQC